MMKRIENYNDFKKAWGNCTDMYKERLKRETLKENDPAAYYLQYCCKTEC